MAPGAPIMATEWTVEARSGGTCVVRVVHSWFAETDEWDGQFEGTEHGWPAFFRDLALYLVNFRGQPSSTFQLMAPAVTVDDFANGDGVFSFGRARSAMISFQRVFSGLVGHRHRSVPTSFASR